jgi:hypothetical protein
MLQQRILKFAPRKVAKKFQMFEFFELQNFGKTKNLSIKQTSKLEILLKIEKSDQHLFNLIFPKFSKKNQNGG